MIEIRKTFHQQLDEIRQDMVVLAGLVTEMIPRGTEILLAFDLQAANDMIDDDDRVDALALDIEERCYNVLALQQPMASDLRAIITAMRLVAELERSADLMVNVCKGARRLYPNELPASIRGHITTMSDQAARLYRLAVDSYVEGDAGLASALNDIDDQLDDLHKTYISSIFEVKDQLDLQVAVQLALIGRFYERVGDHAVNIGERVRYMVDGWLPEHTGAAREAARLSRAETPAP
jgi:phosphate transport system protein